MRSALSDAGCALIEKGSLHTPVMLNEVLEALQVTPGGIYVDCTAGTGGHASAILERCLPGGRLLGLDADPEAMEIARERLRGFGDSATLVRQNFRKIAEVCLENGFSGVNGILMDLGLSRLQIEHDYRGFSFMKDATLDMRIDPDQEITADKILNSYPEQEIADILYRYGEERRSREIAHRIVTMRPIKSTLELAGIAAAVYGGRKGRINPATRTFMALRIAVNDELDNLKLALYGCVPVLFSGGRLVMISYHSLEDRIVKHFAREQSTNCICPPGIAYCNCGHRAKLKIISRKVIKPSADEVRLNPKSRSAHMRVMEKI